MKVIVFGGTGWVGHEIVKAFAGAGYDVTVCSRGIAGRFRTEVTHLPYIQADKNNPAQMAEIFKTHPFDVIIDSVPTEMSMENIKNFATRLKHYIHCSSTGGYAPLLNIPGDETMPYESAYGSSWARKKIVDAKVIDWQRNEGFPGTVIRPSYIAGAGRFPLDNLGGRREDFIADLIAEKVIDLPDNGQTLLHPVLVRDLGRSFRLAVEHPQSIGEIYNICLKKAVTLTRYVELNAQAVGHKARINYVPVEDLLEKNANGISETGLKFFNEHMCFDISKAKEQLDFEPSSTVEAVIEENAKWVVSQYKNTE